MLYVVELPIRAEPGHLVGEMGQMRTWLDHMRYQPIAFRQLRGGSACRVDFTNEAEAASFAKAFSGRLLNIASAA